MQDLIQAQFRMDEGIIRLELTTHTKERHAFALSSSILMILLQQAAAIVWNYFKLVPRE